MLNPRLQSQQCSYKRGNSAVLEYILHLHFFFFQLHEAEFFAWQYSASKLLIWRTF